MTYEEARERAQQIADQTGRDMAVRRDHEGGWEARHLPRREDRSGWEIRCEVVSPMRPREGHGPTANLGGADGWTAQRGSLLRPGEPMPRKARLSNLPDLHTKRLPPPPEARR